jgi:hypothetical protein
VADESHSGQERDEKADASNNWIASFRDVVFSWNDPEHADEPPRRPGDDWWRALHAGAAFRNATGPTAPLEEMPTPARSRRRVEIVAAMVVVLVVVAAVGAVALLRRSGGGTSAPSAATTASTAAITTTIAPASAASSPSATPGPFTVRSACGGRDCPIAVRESPSRGAKMTGSLRAGEVVQVNCSTRGELVEDRDTGQRSDVWYRLAGTNGYTSSLYLTGPTVPDCGAR